MTSSQVLFDKNCHVKLQTDYDNTSLDTGIGTSTQGKTSGSRSCQIRIIVKLETSSSPTHKQELVLRLTDDNNCFFLYSLHIGEDEFQIVKQSQGLLVDFATFPASFIQLLKLCDSKPTSSSNYLLSLTQSDTTSAHLNILETNAFRQITHLSLRFINGDDTTIKNYLAECLLSYKENLDAISSELTTTKSMLTHRAERAEQEVMRLEQKSSDLQREILTKTDQITLSHKQQMAQLRDEKSIKEAEQDTFARTQRQQLEDAHRNEKQLLDVKILELESVNKELTERKFRADSQLREQKVKIQTSEDELGNARTELKKLRSQNHDFNVQHHEHETTIASLKTQVALLEQEVKNKLELIDKTSQQQYNIESQRRLTEERLEDLRLHNQKLNDKLQSLGDEMLKANEIIKKQHTNLKDLKYKNEVKNMVALQQEEIVKEKTTDNQTLKKLTEELEKQTSEQKSLIEKFEKKTAELESQLKNNENCIQWLNKQLNERQLAQNSNPQAQTAMSYTRNVSSAMGGMTISNSQPKHSSTPMVSYKPPSRGAATAAVSLLDSIELGKGDGLVHKENVSPRTPAGKGQSVGGLATYGIDPKYFSPSTLGSLSTGVPSPIKTNGNAMQTTGLASGYLDGILPRKNQS